MRKSDYVPIGIKLSDGEEVHVHHCKSGKDNDKLYIKRDGDKILAYCHHCGGKGVHVIDSKYSRVNKYYTTKDVVFKDKTLLPPDITYTLPSHALRVYKESGIPTSTLRMYGIGYTPSRDRLVIPIYHDSVLCGYQMKRLTDEGPKYITYTHDKDKMYWHKDMGTDCCVVVEDVASAIKVSMAGYSSMAVLGTKLTDSVISILLLYKDIYIWLDNDNNQVKRKQNNINNTMKQYTNSKLILTTNDPKLYSIKDIKEIIDD